MASGRARLKDVAAEAGVSTTTVSFVLNGRGATIPPETQQRVHAAVQKLHYRPHSAARALATGRTRRVGIVLNQPESFATNDTFFSEILGGIVPRATEHDRNILLLSAHYADWQALFADITGGAVDGVLQISRFVSDALTPALIAAEFPVVCVSFQTDDARCYSIDCDNVRGGFLAAKHLLDLGHRAIGVLYPGDEMSWGSERLEGVVRALRAAGLDPTGLLSFAWDERALPNREWVQTAVEWFSAARPRPTALICCDEIRARMLTELLPQAGYIVPDDVSVVSFNSTEISTRCTPPMTSVGQPLPDIGRAAIDMLIARIRSQPVPSRIVRFPMFLDVRESTAPPRTQRNHAASYQA